MSTIEASEAVQQSVTELEQGDEKSLTSLSTEQQPQRDRLTTLPPELLEFIFEFVRLLSPKQMTKAICRALLPFTRKNLYTEVVLADLTSLKSFAQTVVSLYAASEDERRQAWHLGSLVGSLKVLDVEIHAEDEDKRWIESIRIGLFAALRQLTSLTLRYSPLWTKVVLSEDSSQQYLRHLKYFEIEEMEQRPDHLRMCYFSNLLNYPTLEHLSLTYRSDGSIQEPELNSYTTSDTWKLLDFPLRRLDICASFHHFSVEDLVTFLGNFRHLRCLRIKDDSGTLDWDLVLGRVTSELEDLHLQYGCVYRPHAVSNGLSRFIKLTTLSLGTQCYDEQTLIAIRSCSCLELVVFRYTQDRLLHLSYDSLRGFLWCRGRPPFLRALSIDLISPGRCGRNIDYLSKLPVDRGAYGWSCPTWYDDFSYEDAVSLVHEAKEAGVSVTGSLLEGMRVQANWNNQVARIEERFANERKAQ